MPNNLSAPPSDVPPPGRYGTMTVLPAAELGNPTPEELTYPVAVPRQRGRSLFIEGPAELGNATAEELAWPVVSEAGAIVPQSTPAAVSSETIPAMPAASRPAEVMLP